MCAKEAFYAMFGMRVGKERNILLLRIFMNSFPAFKPFERLCIQYQISHIIFRQKNSFACFSVLSVMSLNKCLASKCKQFQFFANCTKEFIHCQGKTALNIFSDICFRNAAVQKVLNRILFRMYHAMLNCISFRKSLGEKSFLSNVFF